MKPQKIFKVVQIADVQLNGEPDKSVEEFLNRMDGEGWNLVGITDNLLILVKWNMEPQLMYEPAPPPPDPFKEVLPELIEGFKMMMTHMREMKERQNKIHPPTRIRTIHRKKDPGKVQ